MRIKLQFTSGKNLKLPGTYSELQQALIYNLLDDYSAEWLHNKGYKYEKRSFKLFTYSPILEKADYDKQNKLFYFSRTISFYLSSPITWILEQVARNSMLKSEHRLGQNDLLLTAVEIMTKPQIENEKLRINALSPIEIHSTIELPSKRKKTYYYNPDEPEFSQLISENLRKKWASMKKKACPHHLMIEPVNSKYCKKRVRYFKGIVIEGYTGHYYIQGDPEFMEFALDVGLGSRNSAGFGMVEEVKKRGNEVKYYAEI